MSKALTLLLLFFALAAPADAGLLGLRHSEARLVECDEEARSATFQGDMRSWGRATRLQMRFTLQTTDAERPDWTRIDAPTFDTWVTAAPGKARYVYDKQIENLLPGAAYRAVVRFRWRNAAGDIVSRAVRRTRPCRQPDPRANLVPERLKISAGTAPDTRTYEVVVDNDGERDAPAFAVGLTVNGVALPDNEGPGLAAEDRTVATFEGPPCTPGSEIVATADSTGLVDEADEADNTLTMLCPV